jgi:hypothetical protein
MDGRGGIFFGEGGEGGLTVEIVLLLLCFGHYD